MMKVVTNHFSLSKCWNMVNRIDECDNDTEKLKRCEIAEGYLVGNKVIDDDDFDQLMSAVSYLRREAYQRI